MSNNDTVYLLVDGKRISNFKSYAINTDMYSACSTFDFELIRPETTIKLGMQCQVWVNDQLELSGIIEHFHPRYDKSQRRNTVSGRGLMGWCVDSHVLTPIAFENLSLQQLTQKLVTKAPFVNLKNIQYDPASKKLDTDAPLLQISAGQTVFQALSEYAKVRGLLFYELPNGSFVFGRPAVAGRPEYQLVRKKSGIGNNIEKGEMMDDLSKRFSPVIVAGQMQTQMENVNSPLPKEAVIKDPDFPSSIYKPFVLVDQYFGYQPALQARMMLEKMRHDGFQLLYEVVGHSQAGKNYLVNKFCGVIDESEDFQQSEIFRKYSSFLIYGREFIKNRTDGTITRLKLGLPGLAA